MMKMAVALRKGVQILIVIVMVSLVNLSSTTPVSSTQATEIQNAQKRFDTSVLRGQCGRLGNRCRHIPAGRCVRACVQEEIRTVCRIPPVHDRDRRCIVIH